MAVGICRQYPGGKDSDAGNEMSKQFTACFIGSETAKKLLRILLILLYFILLNVAANYFYLSDCLIFGPEQIAGRMNVGYLNDGSFYYTNPAAMFFRYMLYLFFSAVLTWIAAAAFENPGERLRRISNMPGRKMRRLLFACIACTILICSGVGIFSFISSRNAKLWQEVSSFSTLEQYEKYFGKPQYHLPEVNEENFEQLGQNRRMCDLDFARGKEVYVFRSTWPFRRFFVWRENGRIIKITWRGGR